MIIFRYLNILFYISFKIPPQGWSQRGGSHFIPYIFFYGFWFSLTSGSQIMNKSISLYFTFDPLKGIDYVIFKWFFWWILSHSDVKLPIGCECIQKIHFLKKKKIAPPHPKTTCAINFMFFDCRMLTIQGS